MWYVNIDKLDTLPFRESRYQYITRKYGDMWDLPRFDNTWHRTDRSGYPWVKAERSIKRYLGKSYAKAFSHFCKQVEQYEQYEFDEYFRGYDRRWNSYPAEYIVDDNGNIQRNPEYETYKTRYRRSKKRDSVTFKSFDYKESYVNIHTGEINDNPNRYNCSRHKPYGDWVLTVVEGFWKQFDDVNDKEYYRLKREDQHRNELNDRRYKKWARYEKAYSFLTRAEEKLIEEREIDLIKRDAHGFDDNSFKGIEYHGQKRKNNSLI
jgi:hypothetical protein